MNGITKEMKDIARKEVEKRRKEEKEKLKVKIAEERKIINAKYDTFIKQINALQTINNNSKYIHFKSIYNQKGDNY